MSNSSIDSGGSVTVSVSDIADGTDGELITWDASGNAATVAVGTATHVLTSNGVGVAPTFQASGGGKVLQVVSSTATGTQSVTAGAYTDLTDLSVSITPASTSNKVLVMATIQVGSNVAGGSRAAIQLVRDSTAICIGDADGSRTRASASGTQYTALGLVSAVIMFEDSPATTSATTYKIQGFDLLGTIYINRTPDNTDASSYCRTASTIMVMEIDGT